MRSVSLLAAGALVAVALLELMLQLLPVSTSTLTGYYVDPAILGYPSGHTWRVATGWDLRNTHELRSNNLGFAADRDFVRNREAVVLIGDSQVEASMLAADDRPAAQLDRAMAATGRPVYGMGVPGSSLLDYAERIRLAHDRLDARTFVLLVEDGDMRQSTCGSGNVHSACIDAQTLQPRAEYRPEGGQLHRLLSRSALAQYFVSQLKIRPHLLPQQLFARSTPDEVDAVRPKRGQLIAEGPAQEALLARTGAAARLFFERVDRFRQDSRIVIVLDGRRSGFAAPDAFTEERSQFMRLARDRGFELIDAESVFARHLGRSGLSLTVGPYDAHLNRLGVQLLTEAAAAHLATAR